MRFLSESLILVTLALAGGCVAVDRAGVGREDFSLYRATRVSESVEERLFTSYRYLRSVPDGHFHSEVRAWFVTNEPKYYQNARNSLPKLRAYLDALPDGPHAKDAAARIAELELEHSFERQREERSLSEARAVQSEVERAREGRRAVVRAFVEWVRLLSEVRTFGEPTSALDDQLIYRFRLEAPEGACEGNVCRKTLELGYAIPEDQGFAERKLLLDVEFELEDGGVRRVALRGASLFSRAYEALELKPVASGDGAARVAAIARVTSLVENSLDPEFARPGCSRRSSSLALEWACPGRRVTVTAGESSAQDSIVFDAAQSK